ncbi:unnamed protein product [Rotaria sp. Silwood1]|nr:unnamed protein product [Rotaria sp. Silwood1]CAF3567468.1 unnamed protein product [Rotaria sp. Silwood1]CAF4746948.1 unnamed protein product [Rotaria sp. Silwood1]CAF4834421.1 unnamed protein product [Rotaria sp. Silwood1]
MILHLQKLTWSSQTLRNCIKFYCVTTLDGTFIDIQGGYGATDHNNEETIINSLTSKNYAIDSEDSENNIYHNHMAQTSLFKNILKDDDILTLDRGYRRMKKRQYQIKILQSINKGKSQLSTKQANESRLVTFHRNVVERAIGRLTGCYGMNISKRYFINSINHMKIFQHKSIENCIKVVGIASRFVSGTKHSSVLKFYPGKPEDTKFCCCCKSGARTTNPSAHALCILMLIHSIQKQLPRLVSTKTGTNYHNIVNIEKSSLHYQAIYDNIMDCKIYKEWSTSNKAHCVCNEPYEEGDWMVKCINCHKLYHPSCTDQSQKEIEDYIDKWKCPYCQ